MKTLEGAYNSVQLPSPPVEPTRFGCLWLVLAAIGIFLFVVPGVAIIVWRLVSCSKKKKVFDEEYAAYNKALMDANQKRQVILEKAQSLV